MAESDFVLAGRAEATRKPRLAELGILPSKRGEPAIGGGFQSRNADRRRKAQLGRTGSRGTGCSAAERRHLVRLEWRGSGHGAGRARYRRRWSNNLSDRRPLAEGFRRILYRLRQPRALAFVPFSQFARPVLAARSLWIFARQPDVCACPGSDAVAARSRLGSRLSSNPSCRRAAQAGPDRADRLFPAYTLSCRRIAARPAEPPVVDAITVRLRRGRLSNPIGLGRVQRLSAALGWGRGIGPWRLARLRARRARAGLPDRH